MSIYSKFTGHMRSIKTLLSENFGGNCAREPFDRCVKLSVKSLTLSRKQVHMLMATFSLRNQTEPAMLVPEVAKLGITNLFAPLRSEYS